MLSQCHGVTHLTLQVGQSSSVPHCLLEPLEQDMLS